MFCFFLIFFFSVSLFENDFFSYIWLNIVREISNLSQIIKICTEQFFSLRKLQIYIFSIIHKINIESDSSVNMTRIKLKIFKNVVWYCMWMLAWSVDFLLITWKLLLKTHNIIDIWKYKLSYCLPQIYADCTINLKYLKMTWNVLVVFSDLL